MNNQRLTIEIKRHLAIASCGDKLPKKLRQMAFQKVRDLKQQQGERAA